MQHTDLWQRILYQMRKHELFTFRVMSRQTRWLKQAGRHTTQDNMYSVDISDTHQRKRMR